MRLGPISLILASILIFAQSDPTHAVELVVSVDNTVVAPSTTTQSHVFDVVVTHDLPTPPSIAGFQFVFEFSGPAAMKAVFTGVAGPSRGEYIFATEDIAAPVSQIANAGNRLEVGDFLTQELAEIANGQSLFSVKFDVNNQFEWDDRIEVKISIDPNESFLAADARQMIPFTVRNGQVSSVPEPSSITFVWVAMVSAILIKGHRCRTVCVS